MKLSKIKVTYLVQVTEEIEWPDSELDNLTYDTLELNLNPSQGQIADDFDITGVKKDGQEYEF